MQKIIFLSFYCCLFFSFFQTTAQDVAPQISGVVNNYASVTGINKCNSRINTSSSNGFTEGMTVLLIQMKGATIEEGNDDDFGKITALRNVGRYEFNVIQSISGNDMFLFYNISNDYDTDGSVQIVGVPEYAAAEIEDVLTGDPWNGELGGVVALKVNGTLTMNADIDATALGFRGGKIDPHENPCRGGINNANNYHYERGNWRGAEKGEGIADYISDKELGRGPQANGGGGGNDHNSGGGGGANVNGGGDGGERSTSFLSTSCRGGNPGLAGRALPADNNRIYLGGGGGAGHSNNTAGTNGGAGGGIVIIQAQEIIANGNQIIADGESVEPTNGADGGGGGGAGGTVVLDVATIDAGLTVFAEGGNGGDVNHRGIDECFGPGGGGSGGRVLSLVNTVNSVTTAGLAGLITNSESDCNGESNGADAGTDGNLETFAGIIVGDELGGEFKIVEQPEVQAVCPNQETALQVVAQGSNLTYQWQVNAGNGFTNLEDDNTYTGAQSGTLTIREVTAAMMDYEYLLVIVSGCASNNLVSNFITLTNGADPVADFEYDVAGLNLSTTNNSVNGVTYEWDFGDGNTSTIANPTHTYATDGNYTLTLTTTNGCGSATQTVTLFAGTTPTADFAADQTEGCTGTEVSYTNRSSANATSKLWLFEGGTPGTSTEDNPIVIYNAGGSYNVTLIVSNPQGTDTLEFIDYIYIDAGPGTSFFTSVNELEVDFNNTSVNADSYLWNFGDGNTSTEASPLYAYADEGEYMVTLMATNDCGTNTFSQNITTGLLPNADFTIENGAGCSPVAVNFLDRSSGTGLDSYEWTFTGGDPATSTEVNPVVTYGAAGEYTVTLTVTNNLGSSTTTKERIIKIAGTPVANFDYTVVENTVTFTNLSTDATAYGWTFGDANFSNVETPTHTYRETGLYYVTLNASNTFCGNSITIPISIVTVDVADFVAIPQLLVYPNPAQDQLNIELQDSPAETLIFRIFDPQGRLLRVIESGKSNNFQLDLRGLSSGMYFIHTVATEWQQVTRVVKK